MGVTGSHLPVDVIIWPQGRKGSIAEKGQEPEAD
jgi:hypothetical protein